MRRVVSVFIAVLLGFGLHATSAQASVQSDFIRSLVGPAQEAQRETGIPASVTIGMAALETGWGRSSMAKPPMNTLFNIKCTATKSKYQKGCSEVASYEYDSRGRRYLEVSGFRTYANTGDSLKDFGLFLTTVKRYANAFNHTSNPDAFIREVHRAGYATDPRYTELIVGIMRSNNLYQYNLKGQNFAPQPAPTAGSGSKLPVTTKQYSALTFGNKGQHVTTLQRLLAARMGRKLSTNGTYDASTQAAVADWQYERAKFPEQTGDVDRATWESVVPTLRQGDRGALVTAMQHELRHAGYTIAADGIFGSSTRAAVDDFQRRHGLPVTGTVATMTWGRLLGN